MEIDRYLEIQKLCNIDTYRFLHGMHTSPEKFHLNDFFEYITAERDIKYIEHNFSTKKVVGHYMRDELGKSIMINDSNTRHTKNVGRVHEIGHDTLHLSTDSSQNFRDGIENLYTGTEKIEIEANTAAMMYYIPDISLYVAISDPQMNYVEMLKLFDVPDWLLQRRIIRFLQINCMMTFDDADFVVFKYKGKSYYDRNSLLQEMVSIESFEKKIIGDYIAPSFFTKKTNKRSIFEQRKLFTI
ncbi:hypothetical protein IGI39_003315 [Enterococcus sp. AZ135]|uniref:ImmA/IrrE family metallo-endopeptidase n=1 Tax=unclassified Enterococcus TaxID=2608891 RepID=UPI003F2462B6